MKANKVLEGIEICFTVIQQGEPTKDCREADAAKARQLIEENL